MNGAYCASGKFTYHGIYHVNTKKDLQLAECSVHRNEIMRQRRCVNLEPLAANMGRDPFFPKPSSICVKNIAHHFADMQNPTLDMLF